MAHHTPQPAPHAEAAKGILDKIRALRAEIPGFTSDAPGQVRRLVTNAAVADAVLESASAAIQASPRLEQASGADAATLRDAYAFALAYETIVKELISLARAVKHTIRVARAEAGESALDVYAIARRLSKRNDGAELRPFVEDIRRALKKRSRRTISEPAPAPVLTAAPSTAV